MSESHTSWQPRRIPIAVTGLGCRLPGCHDPRSYWEMILRGECRVAPAPEDRFDRALYYDPQRGDRNRSYADLACTVDYSDLDLARVDLPPHVRLCPELAFTTLYLTVDQALRRGGEAATPQPLPPQTAVYVGHTRKSGLAGQLTVGTYIAQLIEYLRQVEGLSDSQRQRIAAALRSEFREQAPRRDAAGGPDLASLNVATMVSRGLGLRGPAMAFNSACASSLSAVAQAVRGLQLGTIDAAIVGASSYFHQDTLVLFSHAQSLSATGSRPLDAAADGIVVGEGYAAVVLRREADAIAEQIPYEAVIRGVGLATDGKGKSLWAPRAEGQQRAVRRAYECIDDEFAPQYIEAHATGTQLGDATELTAIASALGRRNGNERIAVGSVKSNIGHTLEVAGLAGLIKAILSVREGVVPPTAGIERLNPRIAWDETPFEVPTTPQPWPAVPAGQPRRTAVNSFGIGGLNVHLIIDRAEPSAAGAPPAALTAGQQTPPAVAVVGAGVVAAGCPDREAFWQRMRSGVAAIGELPPRNWQAEPFLDPHRARPWHLPHTRGGYVRDFQYDWRRHKIPPKQIAHASPLQFMILEAVEQALLQAFGSEWSDQLRGLAERTGVIVGTVFGGDFANQLQMGLRLPEFARVIDRALGEETPREQRHQVSEQFKRVVLEQMPALLDETGSFTSSSLASRVTKTLNLFGGAASLDAGNCAGAAALQSAVELLQAGDCDAVLCVAAHSDMTPTRFEGLALSGVLALDEQASGLLPGEGCVVMLLRREADAVRDGQTRLCRIERVTPNFGPRASPPYAPTPTQRLVGHTFGASALIELLAALATPETAARTITSIDPSGLRYELQIAADPASVNEPVRHSDPLASHAVMPASPDPGFPYFDATERRKQRLRQQARTGQPSGGPAKAHSAPSPPGAATADSTTAPPPSAAPPLTTGANSPANPQLNGPTPGVPSAAAPFPEPPPTDVPRGLPPAELRQRLVAFVIDQTGYPEEMVEMDADLEADLGLDSIKKAQLLGELNEFYQLSERDDIDLDQFTTLAAIESFLLGLGETSTPASAAPAPAAPAPGGGRPAPSPKTPASAASASPETTPAPPPAASGSAAAPTPAPSDVATQMIAFVVDQTGYPEEMVDMDADLEADLGIDSIKKAQLLAELAETYQLEPDESISLDELTSLETILELVMQQLSAAAGTATAPPSASQPPASQPPAVAPASTPEGIPAAAATEELPGGPAAASPASLDTELLRQRMMDFVVEQTGYPPEMVEFDADLEADLGIDSIKKAQLLAELQEIYQFPTRDDLTLDDFPDLQSIESFVTEMCVASDDFTRAAR